MMTKKQSYKKKSFQVRIDIGWRTLLRKKSFETDRTFKSLVEESLAEYWGPISEDR